MHTSLFALLLPLVFQTASAQSCEPYKCADGTQIARCSEDGTVINYFAAPCHDRGGEVETVSFSDVPSTHANADAIAYVKAQGIVSGYSDGTFRPDQIINRAEFTKIIIATIANAQEISNCHLSIVEYLSDLNPSAWYTPYVCMGKKLGIITGHLPPSAPPYFGAAEPINAIAAAKILAVGFDIGEPPIDCLANWGKDCQEAAVRGDVWYKRHIVALAEKNAIPLSINYLQHEVTRGEMAEMIYRLKTNVESKPSHTYESLSTANLKRLYRNDVQEIQFQHPTSFKVVTDETHMSFPGGKDWYRIVLKDEAMGNATLVVEVNPDGYGPFFPDILITAQENADGSLHIVKTEKDEIYDSKRVLIVRNFEASNGNRYYFRFSHTGDINIEPDFYDILRSVKIGNENF